MNSAIYNLYHKSEIVFHDSADHCLRHLQKIQAAFGAHSPLSSNQKYYRAAKLLGVGSLVFASGLSFNLEGVIGGSFAIGDELLKVEEFGEVALKNTPQPKFS